MLGVRLCAHVLSVGCRLWCIWCWAVELDYMHHDGGWTVVLSKVHLVLVHLVRRLFGCWMWTVCDVFGLDVVGDEYFIMHIMFEVGYRIWCIWY